MEKPYSNVEEVKYETIREHPYFRILDKRRII